MENCGIDLIDLCRTPNFSKISKSQKLIFVLDMMRQMLKPLQVLHKNGYVHSDIKPQNICMKLRETPQCEYSVSDKYQSKYVFTLIDFGAMTKFKLSKLDQI